MNSSVPFTRESAQALIEANADAFALGALSREDTVSFAAALTAYPEFLPIVDDAVAVSRTLPFGMPLLDAPGLSTKLDLFARIDGHNSHTVDRRTALGTRIVDAWRTPEIAPPAAASAASASTKSWQAIVSGALLAPMAIALVVMSLWAWNLNAELDDMQSADESGSIADGSVIEMYNMENMASSNARASIGSMPDDTSAVLLAWDLDPTEDHEVWCEEKNGKKWKVSSLPVGENGSAAQAIDLPKPIDGYARIYVSGSQDTEQGGPELILNIPDAHDDGDLESATPTIGT